MNNNQFIELRNLINSYLESGNNIIIDVVKEKDNYAFGQRDKGMLGRTTSINTDSSRMFYQDLYDWISAEYADKVNYGHMHSFAGEYNYHFEIGENIMLRLLGETSEDKNWIYNRVRMDHSN